MKIELAPFDKDHLDALEGRREILFSEKGVYYTILGDGKKAGIVGFLPAKFPERAGFVQIVIAPDHRGRGLVGAAEDLLARKHRLRVLYATIKNGNIASIRAHAKAGFVMMTEEELRGPRSKGLLQADELRMKKEYGEN